MDSKVKTIVLLALPGVQLLDVAGPLDVFAEANAQAGRQRYRLLLAADRPGSILTSAGVRLLPELIIGGHDQPAIDTLLVAGCPQATEIQVSDRALAWLQRCAPTARRFGSVCSGAFFLAAAGLLDGKRVTTHWAVAQALSQRYPAVTVEKDSIHVRDGKLRTSAGVTAGLDLALSLVEEDLGRDIALAVANQLVMFFKRPGGQSQFSSKGEAMPEGRSALQELQRWVAAHPELDHSVASLAERMNLSPRHFSRLFRRQVGMTPASWVEEARVNLARQLLETGKTAPKQVAASCGFANADVLRRAFLRHVGVTPAEYRRHFLPNF